MRDFVEVDDKRIPILYEKINFSGKTLRISRDISQFREIKGLDEINDLYAYIFKLTDKCRIKRFS